ncbi:hypothetical protein H5410_046231 [Solanum commersonii]|uniref:DUF3444 domain-containing protein n=1 Tax=Solanum commersonii TaxID=4109 RepID=A0A9J5XDS9_SOLCO|nr:hypothetical protein H5410_046231 [Solanum commersonii]
MEFRYPSTTKESENIEHEAETAKGSVDLPSDVGPSTMADNFDKEKNEHCFKVGQVLAAYDNLDAIPRFYAIIRMILSSAFKLHITWLVLELLNEDETK